MSSEMPGTPHKGDLRPLPLLHVLPGLQCLQVCPNPSKDHGCQDHDCALAIAEVAVVVVVAVVSALLVVVVVASDVVDIAAATVGFGRSSAIVSIFAG